MVDAALQATTRPIRDRGEDVTISHVGYAPSWDECEIRGNLEKYDACAIYRRNGKTLADATAGRDRRSSRVEGAFERGDAIESIRLAAFGNS